MSTFEDRLALALRVHATTLSPVATRRRHRWPLIAVPVAAAAAAAVFALPSEQTTPASAAELLRSAATAAEREAPLQPGQYLYVRTRFDGRTGPGVEERWTHPDGSGRIVARTRDGVERTKLKPGFVIAGQTVQGNVDVRALVDRATPDAPGFDRAELRAFATYRVLRDILAAPLPGSVRAQAYRTLAGAPGLRIVRRDGDRVLLATRVGDVEFRARIDTGDGRVLALERVLLRRSKQIPGRPGVVDRAVIEAIRRL